MYQSVRDIAHKLWQLRSIHNIPTTPEKDWADAETIAAGMLIKDADQAVKELQSNKSSKK